MAIVALALFLAFGLLALAVLHGRTQAFDASVLQALRSASDPAAPLGPPRLQETMRDITALGSYGVLGIVAVPAFAFLLLATRRRDAALLAAAIIGGLVLSNLLKAGIDRARPDFADAPRVFSASFPSGHAMLSAVVYLTLAAIVTRVVTERRCRVFLIVMAGLLTLIVGLSRIYLGVHYPSDVAAGWLLGIGWVLACLAVWRWIARNSTA